MSIDKSLKIPDTLRRHRNVLTRAERIAKLEEEERWKQGDSVYGLPKVRVIRVKRRHKAAKEEAAPAAATVEAAKVEGAGAPKEEKSPKKEETPAKKEGKSS